MTTLNPIAERQFIQMKAIKKARIKEIDILKALAIIGMVLGHAGAPFTHFIYLFHMAVFIIASGFVYKGVSTGKISDIWRFVLKKLKQLYLPFVICNSIFVLLNNLFIKLNIYTDNADVLLYVTGGHVSTHNKLGLVEIIKNIFYGFLFKGSTTMGGALWFLAILFFVFILYCFFDFIITKFVRKQRNIWVIHGIISLVLLAFGFFLSAKSIKILGIEKIASTYWLYSFGHGLSKLRGLYENWIWKHYLTLMVASFVVLLFLNSFGSISLSANDYTNPFFFIISSISGWCFLYSISFFISKSFAGKPMIYIGQHTLAIMMLHFLSFKLVAVLIVQIYNFPAYYIAAFPNLNGSEGLWWILYTIIGVSLPLLADYIYRLLKNSIINLRKKQRL